MLRIFSILIGLFFIIPVFAAEPLKITEIISHETIQLSDGRLIFLGGVLSDLGAKNYLIEHFQGQAIKVLPDKILQTRYGENIAHIMTIEGRWIQKELIENKLSYAYTMPSFRQRQKELLAAESLLSVLQADKIDKSIAGFQIVEGHVVDTVERGRYVYLNFGEDWRTDFTISIKNKDHKAFMEEGFNALDLKGRRIRVRGWIDHYNGPFITVTYPEQIQIL